MRRRGTTVSTSRGKRRIPAPPYPDLVDSVTLDTLDRCLLHALQIDGRVPFSRIAAVLDVSDRTVARRFGRLRATGALRVSAVPHHHLAVDTQWLVRLRVRPRSATAVARALAGRHDTAWVTELSGGTEIVCLFRVPGSGAASLAMLGEHPDRSARGHDLPRRRCPVRLPHRSDRGAGRSRADRERADHRVRRTFRPGPEESRGLTATAPEHGRCRQHSADLGVNADHPIAACGSCSGGTVPTVPNESAHPPGSQLSPSWRRWAATTSIVWRRIQSRNCSNDPARLRPRSVSS